MDVREPFTSTLGIPICSQRSLGVEGTASLFLGDSNDATKLLEPRHNILVLSDTSFKQRLEAINEKIRWQDIIVSHQQERFNMLVAKEDTKSIINERIDAQRLKEKAKNDKELLEEFYKEISTHWATEDNRVLGHVIFSPPIAVGDDPEDFTQDIAVIDVDPSKVDPSTFEGNFIDLGNKFTPWVLTDMMYPNEKNPHNFKFPWDHLLRLWGTIGIDEMRKPMMYDQNDEPCILVLKNGRTTGLTVGRANNILSYTRKYFDNKASIAKEWCILPFNKNSGAFSEKGDSGAVVVDGAGRIGGILTSGSGTTESFDVSFVTPISIVLKIIQSYKPLANVYIKSAQSA